MRHSRRPRQTKPRSRRLLLACAAAVAILLLFLRLLTFVHGRH
jgi:hypothetical protein